MWISGTWMEAMPALVVCIRPMVSIQSAVVASKSESNSSVKYGGLEIRVPRRPQAGDEAGDVRRVDHLRDRAEPALHEVFLALAQRKAAAFIGAPEEIAADRGESLLGRGAGSRVRRRSITRAPASRPRAP